MDLFTEPNYGRSALLTIDVQRDFSMPGAPAEIPGTAERLPVMARALDGARKAGIPIIHVVRIYREDGSNVDLFRRSAVLRGEGVVLVGSAGAELADGLLPKLTDGPLQETALTEGQFPETVLAEGPLPEAALAAAGSDPEGRVLDCELLMSGEFQPLGQKEWAMYKPRFGSFYQTELEAFLREKGVDTLIFLGCNFPNCPRTTIYEANERDFRLVVLKDALSGLYERGEEELTRIGVRLQTVEEWLGVLEGNC